MSELKPCPFCGCPNIHKSRFGDNHFCLDCDGQAETEDLWNSRADEWISIADRLPENKTGVICSAYDKTMRSNVVFEVWFVEGEFKYPYEFKLNTHDTKLIKSINHWKPLPEPPK